MMANKVERTYATIFSEEEITMEKYTELIKDIARLIVDADRENILLKCDLERTKQQLAKAEEQLETVVAKHVVAMEKEGAKHA